MHKKVKLKESSGFTVQCILFSNSHISDNFHLIEKNKISKSKLESCSSKTYSISEIELNAFALLFIKRRTFFEIKGDCPVSV